MGHTSLTFHFKVAIRMTRIVLSYPDQGRGILIHDSTKLEVIRYHSIGDKKLKQNRIKSTITDKNATLIQGKII